jgi:AcrR family transcriptional regulator
MTRSGAERIRDAERSRAAILVAAERLFAERGYEGTSLSDIGAAAGLSRGSPSYLFGSKERLYEQVLRSAFSARHRETERAFAQVRDWCAGAAGPDALRGALLAAASGYMGFLARHPAFVALVMREELDGARRLRALERTSTAMEDAFAQLRAAGQGRGLRRFRTEEAVLLFVALTFTPFSYRRTLMRAASREPGSSSGRRRQATLAVEQLMAFLAE